MIVPEKEPVQQEPPNPPPCPVLPKRPRPSRRPKPLPCVEDWEFWRFLMTALNLAWDVVKTFLR